MQGFFSNRNLAGLAVCLFLCGPVAAGAHDILFYYNSQDGTDGALLECVSILEAAGNQVTKVDVRGKNLDPSGDNWGPPHDQVWDMRYVNRDATLCGSGRQGAADYFDGRWRRKALDYLGHCGRLFIGAEHYQLADRDEGIYRFLEAAEAVRRGYDDCPPSGRGNSSTGGPDFYPVLNGLGPASFYGEYVGGIPSAYLTGTSFVETRGNWEGDDGVKRSIASGWAGGQLGGEINAPPCARGRLFMVWDATMWTLWQKGMHDQVRPGPPVWDESSWFSWQPRPEEDDPRRLESAKQATRRFFPAVARWLGSGGCPCTGTVPATVPPLPAPEVILRAIAGPVPGRTPAAVPVPPAAVQPVAAPGTPAVPSQPVTLVFSEPPVNLYMRFKDGPGQYRLDIWDDRGNDLKTVYSQEITTQGEDWTSWDGTDEQGRWMPWGTYSAVFSKDGRILRKITLVWISSHSP